MRTETSSAQPLQKGSNWPWELPSARYTVGVGTLSQELRDAVGVVPNINMLSAADPRGQTITNIYIVRHGLVFPTQLTSNMENLGYLWFSKLLQEIERSKSILSLEDDWDGEGSSSYKAATLERAKLFLVDNALRLWDDHHIRLEAPMISPGPDGSIDIHWKNVAHELLINIPEDAGELGTYYGDNKAGQMVKGTLDKSNNLWLLLWLMQ